MVAAEKQAKTGEATPRVIIEEVHSSAKKLLSLSGNLHTYLHIASSGDEQGYQECARIWLAMARGCTEAERMLPDVEPYLNVGNGAVSYSAMEGVNYHELAVNHAKMVALYVVLAGRGPLELLNTLIAFETNSTTPEAEDLVRLAQEGLAEYGNQSEEQIAEGVFRDKAAEIKVTVDDSFSRFCGLPAGLSASLQAERRDALAQLPPVPKVAGRPKSEMKKKILERCQDLRSQGVTIKVVHEMINTEFPACGYELSTIETYCKPSKFVK